MVRRTTIEDGRAHAAVVEAVDERPVEAADEERRGRAGAVPVEAAVARSAAIAYGLLARGLLRPDAGLCADVRDGSYAGGLERVLDGEASWELGRALAAVRAFGERAASLDVEEARLRLEVEYNRLFVGPGRLLAPPYESYYASQGLSGRGGRLRTEDELAVRRAYADAGYAMPDEFVDLPDHMALELDFLSLLCADEAEAWEVGDADGARALRSVADEFAQRHPARWFGRCAALVASGAREGFYPALMRLACALVEV